MLLLELQCCQDWMKPVLNKQDGSSAYGSHEIETFLFIDDTKNVCARPALQWQMVWVCNLGFICDADELVIWRCAHIVVHTCIQCVDL